MFGLNCMQFGKNIGKNANGYTFNVKITSQDKTEAIYYPKKHAVIGISPFNGFFNEKNLKIIFTWAMSNFDDFLIFIPDSISTYTLEALGYPEDKANKKVKKQDNYLKNKALRTLSDLGVSKVDAENKIVCMTQLRENRSYQDKLNSYYTKYNEDQFFREGCLQKSKSILMDYMHEKDITDVRLDIAKFYFLFELPLFLNSTDLFEVSSSDFVYPTISPFLKSLYENEQMTSVGQGYLTYEIT